MRQIEIKTSRLLRPITLLISLTFAVNSYAAGFYLSEVGTPASVGTAGVGTTVNTRHAGRLDQTSSYDRY